MSAGLGYEGPGDGTGLVESIIDDAVAHGIFWANSAGNHAMAHWSGAWVDMDSSGFQNFAPGDKFNRVFVSAGTRITAFMRWSDPWGGSCNDYDLYLISGSTIVARSINSQTCSQNPLEALTYVGPVAGTYGFIINRFSATGTSSFDLLVLTEQSLQYAVAADSVTAPADSASPGMVSVGAVPWSNASILEPFSSQGPMPDGRIKPDLVGIDAVSTFSLGPGGFSGTSAASPHVAGAAALIKQANPGFGPAQIKNFLVGTAVNLGSGSFNNQFGAGRLDLGLPPVPCLAPRPHVGVSVSRAGPGVLQVSITPTDSTIRLRSIQFGDASVRPSVPSNALVDILGLSGLGGAFTTQLPTRPAAVQFVARKVTLGGAITVPIVAVDGCGPWKTFVGSGPGS